MCQIVLLSGFSRETGPVGWGRDIYKLYVCVYIYIHLNKLLFIYILYIINFYLNKTFDVFDPVSRYCGLPMLMYKMNHHKVTSCPLGTISIS